ncbi:hypothetical protein [Maridesulfovibrio sp.]|uniref:hypothetical protein n=1 Tax=unclassified Maridesulfovibrio TaxID=2794999 RepID=UPI003B004BF0
MIKIVIVFLLCFSSLAWWDRGYTYDKEFLNVESTANATSDIVQSKKIVLGLRSKKDCWGVLHTTIYTEAFRRLGINVGFKSFPLKRLSRIIDRSENLDGDISRVYSYSDAHPNLVRVEEPHSISAIVAYSKDPNLKLDGWDSLVGSQLRIDYRHGSKRTLEMLRARAPWEKMHSVHDIKAGLQRLVLGWSEVYICSSAAPYITDGLFEGRNIYTAGVMQETSFHAFLLKKHKELAVRLARVLKQMKKEGLINKYRSNVGLSEIHWQ